MSYSVNDSLRSILRQCPVCFGASPPAFLLKLRSDDDLTTCICQSFELCCRDACCACTATVSFGATHVALANRSEIQRLRMTFPDPPPGITFRAIYGRSHPNFSTFRNSPLAPTSFLSLSLKYLLTSNSSGLPSSLRTS